MIYSRNILALFSTITLKIVLYFRIHTKYDVLYTHFSNNYNHIKTVILY